MSDKVVGKCSNCGGVVTVPDIYHGIDQPSAECKSCGYVKSTKGLPEIDMTPKGKPGQRFLQD